MWFADLETDGFLDVVTTLWCGVFIEHKTGEKRVFGPDDNTKMLDFMDTIDHIVLHNGIGFDMKVLEKLFDYHYQGKVDDSLVLSKLLKPNRRFPSKMPREARKSGPHSIAAWGYRVGRGKPDHEDWTQFSEEMLYRCEEDVEILALAWEKMLDEMKHGSWKRVVPMTMKLFSILQKSEDYGWLVDQAHMNKSLSMLEHWIRKIDLILNRHIPMLRIIEELKVPGTEERRYVRKPFTKAGKYTKAVDDWLLKISEDIPEYINKVSDRYVVGPFCRVTFRRTNLNSNKETKDFLLEEGWQPREWNVDDEGNETSPKLSKSDPFEGIGGGVGRLAARRVQCRHRQSTILGWFKVIREDGRISQRVTGLATTGRAKHQRIVNVPGGNSFFGKWMRQIFIASPGMVLVGTDSSACQMRMLTHHMDDKEYEDAVVNGDIHETNRLATGLATRAEAKTFIYATMFGGGDGKIGQIVKGGSREGAKLKKNFYDSVPKFKVMLDGFLKTWRSNAFKRFDKEFNRMTYYNGWIEGLDGRPVYIGSEHMVLVYMLQSDEAIMMSYAYLFVYKWLCEEGYVWGDDYGIVSFYHDEFTIECKPNIADRVAELSRKAIQHAGVVLELKTSHEGVSKIGEDWWQIH